MIKYISLLLLIPLSAHAYVLGEVDESSLTMLTKQNSPLTRCSTDAPMIEVSNTADFQYSQLGQYMFTLWDLEDTAHAMARTNKTNPSPSEYEKYVTFGISQDVSSGAFPEDTWSLSYGWKYARLVCTLTPEGGCIDSDNNLVMLDQYAGNIYEDPVNNPPPIPDTNPFEGSTKAQVLGLIKQLTTLLTSEEIGLTNIQASAKKSRSLANLQGKRDEVLSELMVIKRVLEGVTELQTDSTANGGNI